MGVLQIHETKSRTFWRRWNSDFWQQMSICFLLKFRFLSKSMFQISRRSISVQENSELTKLLWVEISIAGHGLFLLCNVHFYFWCCDFWNYENYWKWKIGSIKFSIKKNVWNCHIVFKIKIRKWRRRGANPSPTLALTLIFFGCWISRIRNDFWRETSRQSVTNNKKKEINLKIYL